MSEIKLDTFEKTVIVLCFFISFIVGFYSDASATQKSEKADINICFTPGERCDKEIINEINHENKRVLVEAYYLTSFPIIDSIINAHKRGADVKVILDKSQERGKNIAYMQYIGRHAIPVWIDNTVSIAHNKVIILGDNEVITGSYNFTKSAQNKNAENMIIIKSHQIALQYSDNFQRRLNNSVFYNSQKH